MASVTDWSDLADTGGKSHPDMAGARTMTTRKKTDLIVIHCAATKPDQDVGAAEIRRWHVDGNGWSDIGYHFVIRRDGRVEKGRDLLEVGAHAKGANSTSVGICMVGGIDHDGKPQVNFTRDQWVSLEGLVDDMLETFPGSRVIGHRDVPGTNKACPSFDVGAWMAGRAAPTPAPANRPSAAPVAAVTAGGVIAAIYAWWNEVVAWLGF